jgi:hypothetical protein
MRRSLKESKGNSTVRHSLTALCCGTAAGYWTLVPFTQPVFKTLKTLPLTVIVAKSYIQPSIIQPATDDARPTGFQKRPFKRKHQQPPVQFSGSKGF